MGDQGKLKTVIDGDITIVSFVDVSFLDETSIKELGGQLEAIVKEKPEIKLIINFSNVDYLSSAVLGRLVKIYKLVKKAKGKLKLSGVKKNILQVFKITKLDKMFEIFPEHDKAVKSFKGSGGGFSFFRRK